MYRNFGGSRGRTARIAGKATRIAARRPTVSSIPYIVRTAGGSVPNASLETSVRTGRHSASLGGSSNSAATRSAASVTTKDARCLDFAKVRAELRHGAGNRLAWDEEHLRGQHLLFVESLPSFVVEAADRQSLEQQGALDQRRMDIDQELRVEGVVPETRDLVDALDA